MTEFFGEREDMLHRNNSEVIGEMSPATLHLIDEHEKFRAKMASWQKAIENADDERRKKILREIVAFLDGEVECHARKEDEVYFPALEPYHSTLLMYEAHELIRQETESFKSAFRRWEQGKVPFSKVQSALERVFTLLNDHFGEEELVYFPVAEQKWGDQEKAEVWLKIQDLMSACLH